MRYLSKCSLLLLLVLAISSNANGQGSDSFLTGSTPAAGEYASPGILETQNPTVSGWTGAWVNQPGVLTGDVITTSLSFSNLETNGGSVEFPGFQGGRTGRQLTTPYFGTANETVYFSFLMDATGVFQGEVDSEDFGNIIPGYTFAAFELHDLLVQDSNRELQISVGDNFVNEPGSGLDPSTRGNYYLRVQNDTSTAVDLGSNDGGVNLFVVRLDLSDTAASDTVTVYRNPEDLTDESSSTADAVISGLDLLFNFTSFSRFDPSFNPPGDPIAPMPPSSESVFFDELRFGSSFTSVLPLSGIPEDLNNDGFVDGLDLGILLGNWNQTTTPDQGELNGTPPVDGLDLGILLGAWNPPPLASVNVVPEPSSLMLAAAAASVFGLIRRMSI